MNLCRSISFYFIWKLKLLFDIFPCMIACNHFLYGAFLFSYDRLLKFAIHIYLLYPVMFIHSLLSLMIAHDIQWIPNLQRYFLVVIFCHLQRLRTFGGSEVRLSYILDTTIKHVTLLSTTWLFISTTLFWWILKQEMSRCPDLMAAFAVLMLAQKIPRSIVVFFSRLCCLLISNLIALN